jgi:tetratricopeptide (TPR) repeat protein
MLWIGQAYFRQSDYEAARLKFETALKINQQMRDIAGEAAALQNLASIDIYQGKYEAARQKLEMILNIRQQIVDHTGEANTLLYFPSFGFSIYMLNLHVICAIFSQIRIPNFTTQSSLIV